MTSASKDAIALPIFSPTQRPIIVKKASRGIRGNLQRVENPDRYTCRRRSMTPSMSKKRSGGIRAHSLRFARMTRIGEFRNSPVNRNHSLRTAVLAARKAEWIIAKINDVSVAITGEMRDQVPLSVWSVFGTAIPSRARRPL